MKISRILLAAVILGSIFSVTHLQGDFNFGKGDINIASDRIGA